MTGIQRMPAEVRRLRAAVRRALRLLDEGMGDTDVTHRDDPLADAYRTLSRALETDKRSHAVEASNER